MNTSRRTVVALLLILGNILASSASGTAQVPLPGTCGLPNPDTTTFAFAGPTMTTDTATFMIDMGYCEIEPEITSYVSGCGPDYYVSHPGHGGLEISLAQAGFHTPNAGTTTLRDVLGSAREQSHDPYLIQAVTAYLNSLYVDDYAYDVQSVLDGYHNGTITEGSFAWHNHGAIGQFVVPNCPLISPN